MYASTALPTKMADKARRVYQSHHTHLLMRLARGAIIQYRNSTWNRSTILLPGRPCKMLRMSKKRNLKTCKYSPKHRLMTTNILVTEKCFSSSMPKPKQYTNQHENRSQNHYISILLKHVCFIEFDGACHIAPNLKVKIMK